MTPAEITAIRVGAELTQEQLAKRLGVTIRAVQFWEQGLRKPGGPAVCMLEAIGREAPLRDGAPRGTVKGRVRK